LTFSAKCILAILLPNSQKIEMSPIGLVKRSSPRENEKDRNLVSKIVLRKRFASGLDSIENWSHVYVIFWMHKVSNKEKVLIHPKENVGIFATRAPIHPNPVGLTLVEVVKREKNVLWVRGLDALNGTPVLDIKPYPDWEKGRWLVVTSFRTPTWLSNINK
jgi:tRNA-Thr(GGU) m(6)t(6)A37 methyltransferase TsaA